MKAATPTINKQATLSLQPFPSQAAGRSGSQSASRRRQHCKLDTDGHRGGNRRVGQPRWNRTANRLTLGSLSWTSRSTASRPESSRRSASGGHVRHQTLCTVGFKSRDTHGRRHHIPMLWASLNPAWHHFYLTEMISTEKGHMLKPQGIMQ